MTEEDLERTNLMKTMMIEKDTNDEESIIESIEEFEDKIDYLDISDEKKERLIEMCNKIKAEDDDMIREKLFQLLQTEID